MSSVKLVLADRLQKNGAKTSKMAALAKQSVEGNLTSFAGIFSVMELSDQENAFLEALLEEHALDPKDIAQDLRTLSDITSEVKAINNQAALLHGERIKKAQAILKRYRDGAFTSWLIAAYGNRQTPYNFLQYYEFVELLPKALRSQIDVMPRQAVYTLASRNAPLDQKRLIVEQYRGETKDEVLRQIREAFPLVRSDRRRPNLGESAINFLSKAHSALSSRNTRLTKQQKQSIMILIEQIHLSLSNVA